MKMQRHRVDNDRGEWCLSEDVAELEAENERLRAKLDRYENDGTTHAADCWSWGPKHYECALAEIERLKAPHRKLSANEVTEPGCYLVKWNGAKDSDWGCVRVHRGEEEILCIDDFHITHFSAAEFFGPLTPPEG